MRALCQLRDNYGMNSSIEKKCRIRQQCSIEVNWESKRGAHLVNVLASGIGTLTSPSRLKNTFRSVLHSKISTNMISSYIGYPEDAFIIEKARRYDVKGGGVYRQPP